MLATYQGEASRGTLPTVEAGRKAVLLRTSGLEDTGGGGFSEHIRYEEEGVWCRSGTQVIKIEGKAHIKS